MKTRIGIARAKDIIAKRLDFRDDEHDGDFLLNPGMKNDIIARAQKQAAVLIGLVEREGDTNIILTKRTQTLANHSGQVAFPGGKIDPEDASVEAAALREAWEEIGLDVDAVDVVGCLPNYYSGSGFMIAPVIGIVSPVADFEINLDEVEYRFEVPLSFLMNTENHICSSRFFAGRDRFYYEMPFEKHHIWGVTAGMIRVLHDRIFANELT